MTKHNRISSEPTLGNPSRRHLLTGSAVALAAGGLAGLSRTTFAGEVEPAAKAVAGKPLPAYVAWKDPASMIVHTSSTLETKRSAFGTSVITPAEQLYIRNNLPAPDASIIADRDAWEVRIEGVAKPSTLSLKQLKGIGLETTAMVLQCSGNGRGLFPTKASGTAWAVGAAGCVVWSGVPVRDLVAALGGVTDGMVYMTGSGGEKIPEGLDPKSVMVERSVPLKAMGDALLAWEMNGAPIPLAHGGPLRLIVPGYTGVNNIKYIKRLAFTLEQTDAAIQKTGYRLSPPGQKGDPSQPSVWEMAAKSWINSPAPEAGVVAAGQTLIKGVAFGGVNAVKGVEVSIDGGESWQAAKFVGPDLGRYAWRQFVLSVKLAPGSYTIASRVTDVLGNQQAERSVENTGGYNNASWRDHALKITVA
ncbi:sulfite oxidase [Undibacterium piscinae]|uniref:Sulfite oxidase n=1 Tax=Undibacterium piscinae TaxID=2495591 RepID=A0A6M4A6C1_9BURK|nr:sulfite oxidase [Undibacterium piscinae]